MNERKSGKYDVGEYDLKNGRSGNDVAGDDVGEYDLKNGGSGNDDLVMMLVSTI